MDPVFQFPLFPNRSKSAVRLTDEPKAAVALRLKDGEQRPQ